MLCNSCKSPDTLLDRDSGTRIMFLRCQQVVPSPHSILLFLMEDMPYSNLDTDGIVDLNIGCSKHSGKICNLGGMIYREDPGFNKAKVRY